MAQIPGYIIEKIKLFLNVLMKLMKENIKISKVFVLDLMHEINRTYLWSDIDLAIVLDDFTGNRMVDYDLFENAILKVDRKFELIAFKSEQFTLDNPFEQEIIKYWVKII